MHQVRSPLRNGWVPSIGSTTQIPVLPGKSACPVSSPRKASVGYAAPRRSLIKFSTATSASLTMSCRPLLLTVKVVTR